MKILVLVKSVPDTYGQRRIDLTTGLLVRSDSEPILDEIGERALAVALAHADHAADVEVVLVSMGPESVVPTLRRGLAMGASRGIHVVDDRLAGADLGLTARVLAAVARREGFDLIVAGNESTDGACGVLPAMIAEILGVPYSTQLDTVEVGGDAVRGSRQAGGARLQLQVQLPAVVAINDSAAEPRVAGFRGIMTAKRKPLDRVGLDELGAEFADPSAARSIVISAEVAPARTTGMRIEDQGDAGRRIADYLYERGLV